MKIVSIIIAILFLLIVIIYASAPPYEVPENLQEKIASKTLQEIINDIYKELSKNRHLLENKKLELEKKIREIDFKLNNSNIDSYKILTMPTTSQTEASLDLALKKLADELSQLKGTAVVTETDPQVGSNVANYIPKWDGSSLITGTIYDTGNIGIGTTANNAKLHVNGQIKIEGGSPGVNKLLVSDASGLASWSSVGSIPGLSTATWASVERENIIYSSHIANGSITADDLADAIIVNWANVERASIIYSSHIAQNSILPSDLTTYFDARTNQFYATSATWANTCSQITDGFQGGSGTANYIAKWVDGDSLTQAIMYDDGTNVGIGDDTPSYKLDVNGIGSMLYLYTNYINSANGRNMLYMGGNSLNLPYRVVVDTCITSNNYVTIYGSFTVSPILNVSPTILGINTDNFATPITNESMRFGTNSNINMNSNSIFWDSTHRTSTNLLWGSGIEKKIQLYDTKQNYSATFPSADLVFSSYTAVGFDLQQGNMMIMNGNLGVGTTAPTTALYVVGTCSADTLVDRTPYPESTQEAYDAVLSIKKGIKGLDHSKLHKSLKFDNGRNLSATVSAMAEVINDLIKRIDQLENK